MSFVKILFGSVIISGSIGGQLQAGQPAHSAASPSHSPQSPANQKSGHTLTALSQGLLDHIHNKIKARMTQVVCENADGKSTKVDLNQLAKDIKSQTVTVQKTSKDYTFRHHSGASYHCPHTAFSK